MKTYHVDINGNITRRGDKKKKKLGNVDYVINDKGQVATVKQEEDIAPVKTTTKVSESKQKDSYLQKGALSDGLTLKNINKARKATEADMAEDATKGILGLAERVWDGFVQLSVNNAYMTAESANILKDKELTKANQRVYEQGKKEASEYVAKDLIKEEEIARKIITEPWEKRNAMNMERSSIFGSKSDELVQSASDMLVRQGLNYVVPGSGYVLTGLSSLGGEAENAYKNGATYEQALLSGMISAGAEIGTEKIAGIKFGGKTLTEGVAKSIAKKVPSKVLGTLAKWGFNTVGEGAEEVIAGKMTAIGQHLTYASDKEIEELFSNEDAWESFMAGAILGGVFEAGSVATSNLKGVDYVTEVDKNEQKVIEAVYKEKVAEQETDGKKLTQSEKNKIYESVEKAVEKGYVDIETIEKTLGGETYKAYKDTVDKEDALMKEYEDLGNVSQPTLAQTTRYNELTQQVKDIKENSKRNQLKEQLSNEVFSVAQNSRLAESYNEKARRSKVFEADLTKYDAKQQEVVKKAIDSGILNNTNRTHEFVDMIAKISADKGVLFDFANNEKLKESGFAIGDKTINGFVKDGNVTLNIDSAKSLNSVVGHEITHVLEGTELYGELQSIVTEFAKTKGEYDARYQELAKLYENVEGANVDAELVADLVGDYLFTDENFINNLSTEKPNIFKRIYNEIKYLCKVATAGSKEARELEKVKKAFEKAYQENGNAKTSENTGDNVHYSDAKYSIAVKDKKTIDFLENQEHITTYKTMLMLDGKLYSPMATQVKGEDGKYHLPQHNTLGVWQQSVEDPTNLVKDKDGNLKLTKNRDKNHKYYGQEYATYVLKKEKGGGTDVPAAYNPYEHSSNLVLNDQFESAYNRPNLVTVECVIPASEMTSEYKADYAKDSVGYIDWHSGTVAGQLTDNQRKVYLSRWLKPVRIVPDSEVAQMYKEILEKDGISVPFNVVTPSLLKELEKAGVPIDNSGTGMYKSWNKKNPEKFPFRNQDEVKYSLSDSEGNKLSKEQQEYFKDSKVRDENGNLMAVYHGTPDGGFTEFKLPEFLSSLMSAQGAGYYFTDKKNAEQYTKAVNKSVRNEAKKQLYEVYLNIKNPLEIKEGERTITKKQFIDIISKGNREWFRTDWMPFFADGSKSENQKLEFDTLLDKYASKVFAQNNSDGGILAEITRAFRGGDETILNTMRDVLGKDGVRFTDRYGDIWVAWSANQIKNVTNTNPTTDSDIRYSLSNDNQGNQLSDGQKEYFKNSKIVDKQGNLKVMYHGTPNEFTVFNPLLQGGKNGTAEGYGIYFTDVAEVTESYGDKTMSGYLNVTHPARADKKTIKRSDLVKLLKATTEMEAKQFVDDGEYDNVKDALRDTWISNYVDTYSATMSEAYKECADSILSMNDNDMSIIQEVMGGMAVRDYEDAYKFYDVLKNTIGIDGYITEWNSDLLPEGKAQIVVAFDSNQFKNLDNANPTYDPDIRYDLSTGEGKVYGNYNVYGKDIRLDAPTTETETQIPVEETQVGSEIAPLTEDQANERDTQTMEEHFFTDEIAPEIEEPYDGTFAPHNVPADPFFERDIREVGNRSIKAYMYENPEVKPYFQEYANYMLGELYNSVKGERTYNDKLYYETNGEMGFFGTTRFTSEDIAYLLDEFNYTYKDIEKGLKAIIEDNGKENNAISKRIEFLLDERLRKGYKEFIFNGRIPPNQEYINLLNSKEITQYNDEAWNNWLRSLTDEDIKQYFSVSEDVAPVQETPVEEAPVQEVPVAEVTQEPHIKTTAEKLNEKQVNLQTENERQLKFNTESGNIEEEDIPTKARKEVKKALLETHKQAIEKALDDAKNIPMAFMNNTDTIRLSEIVFGRDAGRLINETIFQKEIDNEAKSVRWQNKERADIKNLGIKAGSKESQAVQKYGEGQFVNDNGEVVSYGDNELIAEFDNAVTRQKIKAAANAIRAKYDEYLELANQTLTKLGFDPIPKRKDYFRHFQELNDAFTRFGLPFNAQNMQEHVLPTDINGLTEFWSPQKNYFANAQPRKGMKTELDAVKGIDGYISGIANLIYHTEDIQRGRAFEEMIRNRFGEEHGLDNFDNMTPEEQQARIKQVQENHLSNYAAWVHEWTNNIAGKKNKVDRAVEAMFGRKAFAFLDETRKQVGSNMIGFNVSSSLTNGIAVVQAMAKTNPLAVVKGTGDTIKNVFIKDSFADKNNFLTNRMGTDMLAKKPWEKMRDAGFVFMKGMDWFTSNQVVRSKYYELRAKGMSEAKAHDEAGKFAARIMGDRTKGANAQLYNSKLLGLVTQFQLEVNNQLYSMFYDTYHESKEQAKGNALRTAAGMTFTLGAMSALTHVYGKTFEAVAGYNPTFDIIEIIKTALGWDDEEDEKTTSEQLKTAADMLVDALPYVNILTGGGRVPIASGIPNVVGVMTGGKDQYGNELTWEGELKKLLLSAPPTGGNQFKKTYQGLSMFSDEHPAAGSYTKSGSLRFPVEDTPLNRVQAGLFGQYASKNARDYFDHNRSPLQKKQIEEYIEVDLPIREYWDYREGLRGLETLSDKADYINSLDLPIEKKNILVNNQSDRKEKIDLTGFDDDYANFEEFDFAVNNPEKYEIAQKVGGYEAYLEYKEGMKDMKLAEKVDYISNLDLTTEQKNALVNGETDRKEPIDLTGYENYNSFEEFEYAKENPGKHKISKAVGGYKKYIGYLDKLNDIRADKDANGNSISGSAKEKKAAYINNLNIDYGQKIILYRSLYDSKTDKQTYNADIVEYLNSRKDLSYDEIVTILEELDFKVYSDGTIEW